MAEVAQKDPQIRRDAKAIAREIVERTNGDVRVATPLGLGKPVTLLNALTALALADPSIQLSIFTALTLERPEPSADLEQRFLGPAFDRLFGAYPEVLYAKHLREGTLPANIQVTEFFFQAGQWKGQAQAQQNHVSVNFSDALGILLSRKPNVVLQLVAREGDRLSHSCNADLSIDLLRLRREGRLPFVFAVETNRELPFMGGAASMPMQEANLVLDDPENAFELFSVVKRPVKDADHAIGLHVSRLVKDGGSLQIGIGSIGDAVANALLLRQDGKVAELWDRCPLPHDDFRMTGPFEEGLYAVTEMLVDAMLPLFERGVIKREVDGKAIHAAFFVGCRDFYARLRDMPADRRDKIAMVPVAFTNTLFGEEANKRTARRDARFVNSGLMATLLGAVVSDGTGDGQVISGVGGQADFVAQALALEGARSIIAIPATRTRDGETQSNIVWSYPHVTVPRQMRDIVVTEYGIADLRGRSDAEVVAAMLCVADSRFQGAQMAEAKKAGKLPDGFEIPQAHRNNLPETLRDWLKPFDLPTFPLGTDFEGVERRLLPALAKLKNARASKSELARLALLGRGDPPSHAEVEAACMARMGLEAPGSVAERATAAALRGALRETL
ncbi:butyryl-CoA:acetate CoA-transferase [Jannaschia seosinensis]|uniref:Butyryl-CoA:acetate CoA-transferase n=1 Tax=Jannaschia seosinensis TaxID=313367 RepID=A0A0M7BDD3_9RHOB|nr:acetyl-CoA hydrolase/transferase C-terminal domain-containing protein [Jannaschia seosinensis]CUH39834.1 butyryl-CoA:acetate CoA-transferase [Jannaschia seosinensis]